MITIVEQMFLQTADTYGFVNLRSKAIIDHGSSAVSLILAERLVDNA